MYLLFALLGCLSGLAAHYLLNRLPAAWFTDVGEEPTTELLHNPRFALLPWLPLHCLALALLFPLTLMNHTSVLSALGIAFCLFLLWLIGCSDAYYTIIPDQFSLALAALGLLRLLGSGSRQVLWSTLLGVFLVAILPFLLAVAWSAWRRSEALGFGDIKLLAALALLCDAKGAVIILLFTILLAGISFGLLLAGKRLTLGDSRPLGPYLCLAAACWLLFSPQLLAVVHWYLALFV